MQFREGDRVAVRLFASEVKYGEVIGIHTVGDSFPYIVRLDDEVYGFSCAEDELSFMGEYRYEDVIV